MKTPFSIRLRWLVWSAIVLLFIADWLYPISDMHTRVAGVTFAVLILVGFGILVWPAPIFRYGFLAVAILVVGFIVLPERHPRDLAMLRDDFTGGLRSYIGTPYCWGGESPKGIDCSGLMRRGVIDGLFLRGLRSADAGLIRSAVWIWWHDCTAADLGSGRGQTVRLFSIPSINSLDETKLEPGDMAITQSGNHVMAYLGGDTWIEADLEAGHVIMGHAPSSNFGWFFGPMSIVRWRILDAP